MLSPWPVPDPTCKLNISFLTYTSISIRYSHLSQGYHNHCVVTA